MTVERLDPAALQILISRLTGAAEEMGAVLRRAAYSPNIKERADCSAALFTAAASCWCRRSTFRCTSARCPRRWRPPSRRWAGAPRPGDEIVLNDPFAGGTHLNDVTLVSPCFVGAALVGWVANRAHHADLGGMAPGSMPPEATEIYQEGLRIPPVRLDDAVAEILVASSRTPAERRGDLDAQRGANRIGVERMRVIVEALRSPDTARRDRRLRRTPDARRARGAARRRVAFRRRAGLCRPTPRRSSRRRVLRCRCRCDGDGATFDFTGTDTQRAGNVNAVEAVTVSAVAFALRAATDPTIPANGGAMRPVRVIAPPGTVVAAVAPVAVGAGNVEVSQRVADVCLGALAQVVPEQVGAASQGTMNNVLLGGDGWVYYETVGGGQGARPWADGMSGVQTAMTNTRDTPVEALERALAPPRPSLRAPPRERWCRPRTREVTESSARSRCSRA